eukprot:CAMPEP_0197528596 /NCGR_PEP_ID=MMETSP1318-20131121/25710_1 /TAXON_ID=552666 /ORGANISM="Partenskyella glossopodia, Strain RCC365" /LENGTH=304 /DNA_ID=CAMNT_0043083761 /DNA_START=143 /DNA_END=1057 /DNA_ORIENTATION=+
MPEMPEYMRQTLRLRGGDLESEKARGNSLFQQGRYREARDVYTRAIDSAPDKKSDTVMALLRNRAAAHMKLQSYQGAIDDSTAVINVNPNCNKAHLRRAMAIEKLGDVKNFVQGYRDCRVLMSDGEGATGVETLKELNRIEKKMRDAVRTNLAKNDINAYCKNVFEDVQYYLDTRNLIDVSLDDLNECLDHVVAEGGEYGKYPYAAKCLLVRAEILKQQSCFELMEEDLAELIKVEPKNVTLRLWRCMCLETCERFKKTQNAAKSIMACEGGCQPTMEEMQAAEGYLARAQKNEKKYGNEVIKG